MIVIGGGATGAGAALALATSHNLRVGIVNSTDFGGGTSSLYPSCFLMWGGYPYLVHPDGMGGMGADAGLSMGELDASQVDVLKSAAPHAFPGLDIIHSSPHVEYTDPFGLVDDAGLALELNLAARDVGGSELRSYTCVEKVDVVPDSHVTLTCRDVLTQSPVSLKAGCVVNAAGPGANAIASMFSLDSAGDVVAPVGSFHAIVKVPDGGRHGEGKGKGWIDSSAGADGVLFAFPWRLGLAGGEPGYAYWLVGTTRAYDVEHLCPRVDAEIVEEVIGRMAEPLARDGVVDLSGGKVTSAWSAFRPLTKEGAEQGAQVSDHTIRADRDNRVVHVGGGKWTHCLLMADEVAACVVDTFFAGGSGGRTRDTQPLVIPPSPIHGITEDTMYSDAAVDVYLQSGARHAIDVFARRTRGLVTDPEFFVSTREDDVVRVAQRVAGNLGGVAWDRQVEDVLDAAHHLLPHRQ